MTKSEIRKKLLTERNALSDEYRLFSDKIIFDKLISTDEYIRSDLILIYVSAGSACASNHPAISGVLKGIGAGAEYLDATLRFSLSEFTTKEEIDYTLETLYNCVPMLRKYTRY